MDAKQQTPSPQPPPPIGAEIQPPAAAQSPSPPPHQQQQSASTPPTTTAPAVAEEETRVITLDTIIRKGLVEQMPMTAKDVVNIVSKSMQKERERQAADKLRLLARLQPMSASPSSAEGRSKAQLGATSGGAPTGSGSDEDDDADDDDDDEDNDDDDDDDEVEDGKNGDGDSSTASDGEQDDNKTAEQQQPPIKQPTVSVIQRAPPPNLTSNEMQLADDLRASNSKQSNTRQSSEDPLEDCELRSGDLHYSESNPSDHSDAEPHHHQRSASKSRISQRRKRITGRPPCDTKKPRSCTTSPKNSAERSCTDSQRNAILMQCSAAAASASTANPKASPTDDDDDGDDRDDDNVDDGIGGAEVDSEDQVDGQHSQSQQPQLVTMQMQDLLQVQHTMDDDADEETTAGASAETAQPPPSPAPSLIIKQERLTPDVDDMLEIHHVEDFRPTHLDDKGKGHARFERSSYTTSPDPANADEHQMPYIQAVFSQATTSHRQSPVSGDKQRRDKRKTVAKTAPGVYAELSDNSNEPDAISRSATKKQRSPKAASSSSTVVARKTAATAKGKETDATAAATPQKLHWKTQLKLQRQLHEAAAAAAAAAAELKALKTAAEQSDSQTAIKSSPLPQDERSVDFNNDDDVATARNGAVPDKEDARSTEPPGSPACSADGSPEAGSNKINKIIEPPHHQKRIPKLKYGSFNFTERRSGPAGNKGPKMVLKYKKKYKRKTAASAKDRQHVAVGETERVESTPVAIETAVTTEAAATIAPASLPNGKVAGNASTNAKKATIVKKRKSTKPSSSSASVTQSRNSSHPTSSSSLAEPPHKQAKPTTTGNTATAANKRLISTSTSAAGSSTTNTTTDSTRALRERNKVLFELLEHRIYEIRHLKLRLAHMQQLTTTLYPSAATQSSALPTTPELSNGCPPSFASKSTAPQMKIVAKLEPGASATESSHLASANDKPEPMQTTTTSTGPDATTPDWSADELAQAHYLHSLHPQLYAHLQQHYDLPLPLATECSAWRCQAELSDVVRTMRAAVPHLRPLQRVAVLHVTDLPLRPAYEYVVRSDRLSYTAARRLWVLWARGLHADWQQPMFVSTVGLAELVPAIRECIARLHDIQYTVIACCARFGQPDEAAEGPSQAEQPSSQCNGTAAAAGPSSVTASALASLWQQLGVSRGYTYFSHPTTNEPIYTFHFGDDLLRSVQRNLLHAGGFRAGEPAPTTSSSSSSSSASPTTTTVSGAVTRKPLDELRSAAPAWFAEATSSARILFSARTSELLRAVRPTDYAACADFVDVFAAYARLIFVDGTYGGDRLESQMRTLSHVQLQLYRMRDTSDAPDTSAPATASSNAAIAHTIESLKLLQHTMRQKYGVDVLPVRSVSEDCLRRRWQSTTERPESSVAAAIVARSLRETLTRLVQVAVPGGSADQSAQMNGNDAKSSPAVPSMRGQSSSWPGRIDVSLPERHYVQQLIEDTMRTDPPPSTSATVITLADQRKFVASLWRMEEQFQALWTPFFVGGPNRERMTAATEANDGDVSGELVLEHVLRDTLGKCGRLASWPLESSVQFVLRRIALRVAVVNELGGVQRWPAYVLGTTTTGAASAAAAARRSVD